MRATFSALLLISAVEVYAAQEVPKAPKIEYCTLGTEVYACINTIMGGTRYLAIFAKDGNSLIRVIEITKRGKQYTIYPRN